jgi:hypothetical protein
MNINNVVSTQSIFSTSQTSGAQGSSDATPAVSTEVSGMASLMSQLQQLSQTDPSQFKQVTGEISEQLKASGNTSLADRFAQASQSGDISALQPPKPHGAHHHGHHPHAQAPKQDDAQTVESIISDALKTTST